LPPASTVHDASLRRTVERALGARGRPVRVGALRREPSPYATLFPAEIVTVSLRDGRRFCLFVKHLGGEQEGHPDKAVRDREIRVYEELLGGGDLPVVGYFGSDGDPESGRYQLLLEHVDAWNLRYHDLDCWPEVARRLADLHSGLARGTALLERSDYLLRFDARYVDRWASRAYSAVVALAPALAPPLGRALEHRDRVAGSLEREPWTLVHNDLSPKNVLVDRSSIPPRVCFVDWEMAGVGCALLDLAHFTYGLEPEWKERVSAAYFERLAGARIAPTSAPERARMLAACELVKTIYRLARKSPEVPLERVAGWVAEAEALSRHL
jgi:hypothetical protein